MSLEPLRTFPPRLDQKNIWNPASEAIRKAHEPSLCPDPEALWHYLEIRETVHFSMPRK
jgi:hypothetical protein